MMVKPKHQRLVLVILAVAALIGAVLLAMWGLQDRAAYFVTPSDIAAGKATPDKAMRLGGMVVKGSLSAIPTASPSASPSATARRETPVVFRGITPDLFREGSGVVAEGRLDPNGLFVADNILAKHDERYMPPQMADRGRQRRSDRRSRSCRAVAGRRAGRAAAGAGLRAGRRAGAGDRDRPRRRAWRRGC